MNQIELVQENAIIPKNEGFLQRNVYATHFGFSKLPFSNFPNKQFFFSHRTANNVINTVLFTLRTGEPLVKITGESGTGKTFLINQILNSLRPDFYSINLVGATVKPDSILKTIIEELGEAYPADATVSQLAKYARYLLFDHYSKSDCKIVIWIDDAEKLSVESWEMIEFLLQLQTSERSLLQFVLSGTPLVNDILATPALVKLSKRIAFSDELTVMDLKDTEQYLATRFNLVSNDEEQSITSQAVKTLYQKTGGNPLEINKLAHKAFMLAFGRGDEEVSKQHILSAFEDKPVGSAKDRMVYFIVGLPALLAVSGFAAFFLVS